MCWLDRTYLCVPTGHDRRSRTLICRVPMLEKPVSHVLYPQPSYRWTPTTHRDSAPRLPRPSPLLSQTSPRHPRPSSRQASSTSSTPSSRPGENMVLKRRQVFENSAQRRDLTSACSCDRKVEYQISRSRIGERNHELSRSTRLKAPRPRRES